VSEHNTHTRLMPDHPRHHEPSSAVGPPPRQSLPATSPTTDLLGEPRRYSFCPVHPSHHPHTLALDPIAREPSARCGRPRHRAGFGHGDHARAHVVRVHCGPPRWPGQAAAPWHPTTTAGRQPMPRPGTVVLGQNPGPVPDFIFSFLFDLIKFPELVQTSKIRRNM
jgi:hypothetical protein